MLIHIKSWILHIKRLIYILTRRQKVLGLVLVGLAIFCAILNTLCVYIFTPVVSAMTDAENYMSSNIAEMIAKITGITDFHKSFLCVCILVAILYFLKEIVLTFQLWYSNRYAFKICRELSELVLDSYMNREYDFFLNYGTTKILRDVQSDTRAVNNMLTCITNLITESLTVVMIVIYMIMSDWHMAILISALGMLCVAIMYKGFKKAVITSGNESRIKSAQNQKVLLESIEGVKEIQVMKKQGYFLANFHKSFLETQKPQMVQAIAVSAPTNVVEGIFVIGIMFYIGIRANIDSNFFESLPVIAAFLVGAVRLLPSMGRISNNMNNITFFLPALESVYNNVSLIRKQDVNKVKTTEDKKINVATEFDNNLVLKNIHWMYEDSEKEVLSGLDLEIKKGQSIGIVGQSGAGKSTLADIILGLHIPKIGQILLDGKNIYDDLLGYSKVIGYVPQSVYLTDSTIRENVAFGVEPQNIDDNRVMEVLKQAQLYNFVMSTDNGLDTIIGERGVKFSGGQRQRLAVARALYREPRILILDEATSALDNETEFALMSEIESLYGKMTLIIIAHRLTTVKNCDVIYEIRNGIAVERDKKELFE